MKPILVTVCLIFCLHGLPANALDCSNAMTQTEMNFCGKKDFDDLDKQKTELMAKIDPNLDKIHKEKFSAAEKAWIRYRDVQCEAETVRCEGGSAQQLMTWSCLAIMTKQRIEILLSIYHEETRQE